MRITIASRIFEPEPSAASFRLKALAEALSDAGHDVTVDTVTPAAEQRSSLDDSSKPYRVKRHRVLRDKSGYVRGYVQYLSFDIPLFFRILFGRKADLIVVEPPPTTGFFTRISAGIRRVPYVYYAADIWSDAAQQTDAPSVIVRAVRAVEKWVWRGARAVLSVSSGVTQRIATVEAKAHVIEIGNGVNVQRFHAALNAASGLEPRDFVYAGTASEWHGAHIVLDAYAAASPDTVQRHRLRFIGGGSQTAELKQQALQLGIGDKVVFEDPKPAEELAPILANSIASLATLRPGSGYDFAFPTKLYSSVACGAPVIYAGPGPAKQFVETVVDGTPLGIAASWDADNLCNALETIVDTAQTNEQQESRRNSMRKWALDNVSLTHVAEHAAAEIHRLTKSSHR